MIFGLTLISLAFILTAVAALSFWLYGRNSDQTLLITAKAAFLSAAVLIFSAMILMLVLLFTHRFDVAYVYLNTSRSLTSFYLFSALWAGQEGTFLLWLFIGSVYGIILLYQKPKNLSTVMFYMMLVHLFILLILLKKNPFAMIWQQFEDVPIGLMPADGRGMNPLLINPWMVIHPPVLFLGYVSTQVIFGFVMTALINRDSEGWYKPAWSWILYTTAILGAGLILGGYWAYATLGWGGFWGWDPVENASFVPWVVLAILLHGVLLQNKNGSLVKTNIILGAMTFIMVLYGTFLTRSGVLTDFSVHSFGESGLNYYLLSFLFFFIFVFLFSFIKHLKHLKGHELKDELLNRESFIMFGMLIMFFSAFLTFIGMSFPIISSIWGNPTNVSTSFYNKVHIPIAVLMGLLIALGPFLSWKVRFVKRSLVLILAALVSLVMGTVLFFMGYSNINFLLLLCFSLFMLLTNGFLLYDFWKRSPYKAGGILTHVGIAMMILGIAVSGYYSSSEKLKLPKGEKIDTKFGFQLEFVRPLPEADGRNRMEVKLYEKKNEWTAVPRFFYSEYNRAYMASPDIDYRLIGDIYLAPIQYDEAAFHPDHLVVRKGESKLYDDFTIRFKGFETGNHTSGGRMEIKAILEISKAGDDSFASVQINPSLIMSSSGIIKEEMEIPGSSVKIRLSKINADDKSILLEIYDINQVENHKEALSVEVSKKPMMSFLWIGTFILFVGLLLSMRYRMIKN